MKNLLTGIVIGAAVVLVTFFYLKTNHLQERITANENNVIQIINYLNKLTATSSPENYGLDTQSE